MRKSCLIILGLMLTLAPTRANASELQLQGMGAHDIVTIGGTSGVSGSFYAGEIDWSLVLSPDAPGVNIYTYCVDILNEVTDPQTVRISDTNDAEMVTDVTDRGAKAAWLLNTYAPGIHAAASGVEAAALQVAIWEAISDNVFDLSNGYFTLVTVGALTGFDKANDIFMKANGYLDALSSADYRNSVATWFDATTATGGGQDQITTPEPSSLMLLGLAGFFVRRRKQKAI